MMMMMMMMIDGDDNGTLQSCHRMKSLNLNLSLFQEHNLTKGKQKYSSIGEKPPSQSADLTTGTW